MHHLILHLVHHGWHVAGPFGVVGGLLGAGLFAPECDPKSSASDPFGINDPSACHSTVLGSFPMEGKEVAELFSIVVGGGLGIAAGWLLVVALHALFPHLRDSLPH